MAATKYYDRQEEGRPAEKRQGDCIDVIKEFKGKVPAHLDKLVTLQQVRDWFCEAFQYSEETFKRTHLKELDRDYFRAYFGVRPKETEEGRQRLRPSTDRFYKSRVVWWLIERKKSPIPRFGQGEGRHEVPDPADYR